MRKERHLSNRPGQFGGERRPAERSGKNSDERDADLHGGEKTIGRLGQFKGNSGPAAALIGKAAQPGLLRGHHRNFRHREHSVCEKQQEDDGNFKGNLTHALILLAKNERRKISKPSGVPAEKIRDLIQQPRPDSHQQGRRLRPSRYSAKISRWLSVVVGGSSFSNRRRTTFSGTG